MLLLNQTITIRNAVKQDAAQLCAWWNDGRVMEHAGFPRGIGTDENTVSRQLNRESDETGRTLMIEAESKPIGEMNYRNIGNDTAEIGIKICVESMQGKGYGSMCLSMLIARLFAMGYAKIVLDTNLNNLRAQHVYEKLGFAKVQVNQNAWKDQLGNWQTSVDYALVPLQFIPHE